ncbi:hypothetical protein DXA36_00920 [Eisenbergiella sp. OF01-20]|nr:hypothetical protein DXA36_00920 [Eisenbergiella sp. OF01-20]
MIHRLACTVTQNGQKIRPAGSSFGKCLLRPEHPGIVSLIRSYVTFCIVIRILQSLRNAGSGCFCRQDNTISCRLQHFIYYILYADISIIESAPCVNTWGSISLFLSDNR